MVSRTRQAALPANAGTLLLPRSILARGQLNPYLQGAQARGSNNGKSGADNNVRLLNVDASPEEGMTFHCIPAIWLDTYGLVISESFVVTEKGAECFAEYPRLLFVKD